MKLVKVKNARLVPIPRSEQVGGVTHCVQFNDFWNGWLDEDPERAYEIVDGEKMLLARTV